MEKAMAPHSSTLAWKIPWMEEPGGLQSMGSLRVGHDWATSLSLFTFMHWRRKWQPTPVFLPWESQGRGSLVGLLSLESHRAGQDWSDLAAVAAACIKKKKNMSFYCSLIPTQFHRIHSHLPLFVNSFPGNKKPGSLGRPKKKKPGSHFQHDICLNDVSPLSIPLAWF